MRTMMTTMVSEKKIILLYNRIEFKTDFFHVKQDSQMVEPEAFNDILKVKVYNTHHHLLKTLIHANLDRGCKNGKTAKHYLEKFKLVHDNLTNYSWNVRFEVRARLPSKFSFDVPNAFQFVLNAAIEVWSNSEWIHLPVPHIQRSMERVFDFVKSDHVPPQLQCFDIRDGTKLSQQRKDFAAMTFVNLGYASVRSNELFMETFWNDRKEIRTLPLEWYMYYVWLNQFKLRDPDGKTYSWFLEDEYISTPLIFAVHKRGERKLNGLFWPEWYQKLCLNHNGNNVIEFHLSIRVNRFSSI